MIDPRTQAASQEAVDAGLVPFRHRLSWSAVLGGVVLVVAMQILFAILGAGVGASVIDSGPSAGGFGLGAALWWLASTVAALFVGSYVAARLGGVADRFDGVLHGLVIWSVTLIATLYLLTSTVGGLVGGAFRTLGGVASAAGSSLSASAPTLASAAGVTPETLESRAQAYLQPAPADPAAMTPQEAQKEIATAVPGLVSEDPSRVAQSKARIVAIIAAQEKITQPEAQARFEAAQARLEAARDETVTTAKAAANKAADGAAGVSFTAFAALVIGAIAAAIGGALATPVGLRRRWTRTARLEA